MTIHTPCTATEERRMRTVRKARQVPKALRVGWAWLPLALLLALSGDASAQDAASSVRGTSAAPAPELTQELALLTFDSVWSRIAHTHYDPEMEGVNWDSVGAVLRPDAAAATTRDELRDVLRRLVGSLGLSHFAIFPPPSPESNPTETLPEAGRPGGGADGGDAGIRVRWIEDGLLVTGVRPGSPAAAAGLTLGFELVSIDGWSPEAEWAGLLGGAEAQVAGAPEAAEENAARSALITQVLAGFASERLRGTPGTPVSLEIRDAQGGEIRALTIEREAIPGTVVTFGNLPPIPVSFESEAFEVGERREVGLLRFSAWFPVVVPDIAQAVDQFRTAHGMILDLRGNPGGVAGMAMGVGGHFLTESVDLGEMRLRDSTLRFPVNPQRIGPAGDLVEPFQGPLAILVDAGSASTSEIFAAGMQGIGRARIFGETTAGQALPAVVIQLPTGDRLMHVIADYTGPEGVRLEGRGVIPDVFAPPTREALRSGQDRALDAALAWLADSDASSSR